MVRLNMRGESKRGKGIDHGEESRAFKSSHLLTEKDKWRTLFCLGLAQALDHADSALMPSVLRALEEDLRISPSTLGLFAFAQSICGAISAPFWGRVADTKNRISALGGSMCAWAFAIFVISFSSSLTTIMIARAMNGVALTCLNPLTASLTADLFVTNLRGRAFGMLTAIASIGHILGSVLSTAISREIIFGVRGWRVAFFIVAVLSALGAKFISIFASDPPRGCADGVNISGRKTVTSPKRCPEKAISWTDAIRTIFGIRTFFVITFQGVWGSIPWNAFQFITMWLQYSGFPDRSAAFITTGFTLGHLFGACAGGVIGDWAARRYPNHGRVFVAQFSDLVRLPLIVILFRVLPAYDCGALSYGSVLFMTGFFSPWVSIAANRPILCELVSPNLRGQIFAYQRLIEQISASMLGAPLVGWLSEHAFGYVKLAPGAAIDSTRNETNAHALAMSMECITLVCWGACFVLYGLVHFTYPGDRERANAARKKSKGGYLLGACE